MKKRRWTQLICAVLYNCNFTGFAKGKIYQGDFKGFCAPGLNCYSCPGAVAACPLGSLQSALVQSRYKAPYYVLGVLLLMGILLGRFVCGYLCPFGLIQELLYKIPTPKIKKNRWTALASKLKYVILAVMVIILPIMIAVPAFCKYICPAGTLEAGIPLVIANDRLYALTGLLFNWKVLVLVVCVIGAMVLFRFFCRFICPLGAFYGLFQKTAVVGMKVDAHKCVGCGKCVAACKMDVRCVGDRECVDCGACRAVCPCQAISMGVRLHTEKAQQPPQTID